MFEGKEVRVSLSDEADDVYKELNQIVGGEKKRGIESSFHQSLLRSINRAVELLKKNPFAGNQIPKRQIPKKYLIKYEADNVWRIEIANHWRLIYTITGNKIEIISFIMDIFDHKKYSRVFGYE